MSKLLSIPQRDMISKLQDAGERGLRCPFLGDRTAGRAASAFHRTAQSLRKLGLARIEREGDSIRVFAAGAAVRS